MDPQNIPHQKTQNVAPKETRATEEYEEPELGIRPPEGSIQRIDPIEPGVYAAWKFSRL